MIPAKIQTKPKNNIATFIVCLLLSIVAVFFLVLPKYDAYKNTVKSKADAQAKLDDLKNQQKTVSTLITQLKSNSSDFSRLDMAIPDQANIPDLYALLESDAKAEGLTITSMQAKDQSESSADSSNAGAAAGSPAGAIGAAAAAGAQSTASAVKLPSPTLGAIDANMTVSGSLSNFEAFLQSLQSSLRLIDVQNIDVSADQQNSLTFKLTLRTYYQKK